jgi:hypothetical protein
MTKLPLGSMVTAGICLLTSLPATRNASPSGVPSAAKCRAMIRDGGICRIVNGPSEYVSQATTNSPAAFIAATTFVRTKPWRTVPEVGAEVPLTVMTWPTVSPAVLYRCAKMVLTRPPDSSIPVGPPHTTT